MSENPEALRLLIDTDTAGDDVTALLLALRHPAATVEAVTIVAGNVAFDQQVENALYTVERAGREGAVPVYPGCRTSRRGTVHPVPEIHGDDGMGNHFFPKARQRPEQVHAVDALLERLEAAPGALTVVALGPLTNLAALFERAPHAARLIRHLYVMGGAIFGQGNTTATAEYNIWVDPDAAHLVLNAGAPLTLVSWEMALRHAVLDAVEGAALRRCGTPVATFFMQVHRAARAFDEARWKVAGSTHPDALTMAVALAPDLVTEARHRFVAVDTRAGASFGTVTVDHEGITGRAPNARVVYAVDGERFKTMLFQALSGG